MLINPTILQVLKKYDHLEKRTGYFRQRKKKLKTKFIDFDHAGNDKLLNWLLWFLGWWLMLARRFCVFNAGLKVDTAREISTMIMTSNDENVRSCKRHTVVRRVFCFWWSLCPFLASRLTTVSLDRQINCNDDVLKLQEDLVCVGQRLANGL